MTFQDTSNGCSVILGFPSMGRFCGSLRYSPHGEGRSAAPEPVGGKMGSRGAPGPGHFTVGSGRLLGVHRMSLHLTPNRHLPAQPRRLSRSRGTHCPSTKPQSLAQNQWVPLVGIQLCAPAVGCAGWAGQLCALPKRAPDGRELAPVVEVALPTVYVCLGTVLQLLRHSGQGSNFQPCLLPLQHPYSGSRRAARPGAWSPPLQPSPPLLGLQGASPGGQSGGAAGAAHPAGGGSGRAWEWV